MDEEVGEERPGEGPDEEEGDAESETELETGCGGAGVSELRVGDGKGRRCTRSSSPLLQSRR